MATGIVEIESEQHFRNILSTCQVTQLIVIDFFATWCGPCRMVAPKYLEFSQKYQHVCFLKVDVDKVQSISIQYGVEAMPTFILIKNNVTVETIRGANVAKLENAIQRFMGPFHIGIDPQKVIAGRSFSCFTDVASNDNEQFEKVSTVLIKIANNILKDQNDLKYRQIKLANGVFMNKLLPVLGAVDCLFAMGFQEMDDRLLLPPATSLDNLRALRDALIEEQNKRKAKTEKNASSGSSSRCTVAQDPVVNQQFVLQFQPIMNTAGERKTFNSLVTSIKQVMLYENKELQELARSKIPLKQLEEKALENSQATTDKDGVVAVSKDDCLLLLLLNWFKTEFFSWTNSPKCTACGADTTNTGASQPNPEEKKWGANVVETYRCPKCFTNIRFPRYNHPQKLLETRTGRCGEWANCFTLCCRAVGFEARYVLDWTDHVWTEVYSKSQKRWLHCDACENICDKPLVYESGWGKKLTYVISFSKEQVVDVSWRYSTKHKELIQRRTEVTENWLFNVCYELSKELQAHLSEERKREILQRNIVEHVEFITPKKTLSKEEQEGRLSGSLAWRKIRGETNEETQKQDTSYTFKPTPEDIKKKRFGVMLYRKKARLISKFSLRIRYNIVKDCYYTSLENDLTNVTPTINGWKNGTERCVDVFRKVEEDWKMVYLARTEGSTYGVVTWFIDLSDATLSIKAVDVKMKTATFENGVVLTRLSSVENSTNVNGDKEHDVKLYTYEFAGSKILRLSALMKHGSGEHAWQHAQLFRCSETNQNEIVLDLSIELQEDTK